MFSNLQSLVVNWAKRPFSEDMNAGLWILFIIFVAIVVFAWTRVLKHIID